MTQSLNDRFCLVGKTVVVTGGAGLLGRHHGRALAAAGARVILTDIDEAGAVRAAQELASAFGVEAYGIGADITTPEAVETLAGAVNERCDDVDILINNAANNPKMEKADDKDFSRLEDFPMAVWEKDMAVGLTGAFLCARVFGQGMAERGRGVILNVASDLSVIAPDQRLYRRDGVTKDRQPVKPVTYSVVKAGLVGLTRYLSTYWAEQNVRVNAISPGGVYAGQDEAFVKRLSSLIPMGRMASEDEYEAAVLFLCSDASSYMTGQNLVMDGGRSVW